MNMYDVIEDVLYKSTNSSRVMNCIERHLWGEDAQTVDRYGEKQGLHNVLYQILENEENIDAMDNGDDVGSDDMGSDDELPHFEFNPSRCLVIIHCAHRSILSHPAFHHVH